MQEIELVAFHCGEKNSMQIIYQYDVFLYFFAFPLLTHRDIPFAGARVTKIRSGKGVRRSEAGRPINFTVVRHRQFSKGTLIAQSFSAVSAAAADAHASPWWHFRRRANPQRRG